MSEGTKSQLFTFRIYLSPFLCRIKNNAKIGIKILISFRFCHLLNFETIFAFLQHALTLKKKFSNENAKTGSSTFLAFPFESCLFKSW